MAGIQARFNDNHQKPFSRNPSFASMRMRISLRDLHILSVIFPLCQSDSVQMTIMRKRKTFLTLRLIVGEYWRRAEWVCQCSESHWPSFSYPSSTSGRFDWYSVQTWSSECLRPSANEVFRTPTFCPPFFSSSVAKRAFGDKTRNLTKKKKKTRSLSFFCLSLSLCVLCEWGISVRLV